MLQKMTYTVIMRICCCSHLRSRWHMLGIVTKVYLVYLRHSIMWGHEVHLNLASLLPSKLLRLSEWSSFGYQTQHFPCLTGMVTSVLWLLLFPCLMLSNKVSIVRLSITERSSLFPDWNPPTQCIFPAEMNFQCCSSRSSSFSKV